MVVYKLHRKVVERVSLSVMKYRVPRAERVWLKPGEEDCEYSPFRA